MVLFFKNEGGSLQWFDPAFARGSEDVPDANALWVRAVKLYANVLQLPKQARLAALKDQMEKLRDEADGNNANELLADDIERQLAGCGPVSVFGLDDKICGNPKWVYNIANAQYYRGISRPVEARAAPQKGTNMFALASMFFALFAIGLTVVFYWRKRRERAAKS